MVTATGAATELGHVADLLEGADARRTPLGESLLGADRGRRIVTRGAALTAALQVLLVTVPFLRDRLGLQPLTAFQWLLVTAIAVAYLLIVELDKALHRRATASGPQRDHRQPAARRVARD